MEIIDFWHFCDDLTIIQALLLILGEDPTDLQYNIDNKSTDKQPLGYEAIKTALIRSVEANKIKANVIYHDSSYNVPYLNYNETTIDVESLKAWLKSKGFYPKFFFPDIEASNLDFLNKSHQSYAPKLAAAVNAWLAITENPELTKSKTVKQSLIKWLRENSKEYGFTNEDGLPSENIIDEIAKIANWDTKGGAPKTGL